MPIYQIQPDPDELLQVTSLEYEPAKKLSSDIVRTNLENETTQGSGFQETITYLKDEPSLRLPWFSPESLVSEVNERLLLQGWKNHPNSPHNIHIQLHVSTTVSYLLWADNDIPSTGNVRKSLEVFSENRAACLYLLHVYRILVQPAPLTLQEAYFARQSVTINEYCPWKIALDMWDLVEFLARCAHSEKTGIPLQEQFWWPSTEEIDATYDKKWKEAMDQGRIYQEANRFCSVIMRDWLRVFFDTIDIPAWDNNSCLSEDHSGWIEKCHELFSDPKTITYLNQPDTRMWHNRPKMRWLDYRQFGETWRIVIPSEK
jgi:hypothetical protein